jgi:hypothetical protein
MAEDMAKHSYTRWRSIAAAAEGEQVHPDGTFSDTDTAVLNSHFREHGRIYGRMILRCLFPGAESVTTGKAGGLRIDC